MLLSSVPGLASSLDQKLESEVEKTVQEMFKKEYHTQLKEIPLQGSSKDKVLDTMKELQKNDINPDKVICSTF
jgi:hypothetical protein